MSYLIAEGRLVDPKTKKDITGERLEELTKIDFSTLPLDQAIKVVKGNGSRKLVVFSDVDCPYCKRLEQNELTNITDVTIYTFLYPIQQLHPDSANKSKAIWCASNRVKAWQDWILNSQLPNSAGNCEVPIEKIGDLARKIGVTSTPTLFFADGKRMLGAQPYKEIERALVAAKK
jgi:thiol:disulfide interchange protein DsbC